MNWIEFVAALTEVLVWPLAVVVLVLRFRTSLTKLIERPLERLSLPGVEAVWPATLDAAREQMQESEQGTRNVQAALEEDPVPPTKENASWELQRFGFDPALFQTANEGPPVNARVSGMNGLRRYMNERLYKLTGNVGGTDLREIARTAQAAGIIEVSLFESLVSITDLSDLLTHGAIREDSTKVIDLLKLIRNAHRQFTVQALGFQVMGPVPEREARRANGWRPLNQKAAPEAKNPA